MSCVHVKSGDVSSREIYDCRFTARDAVRLEFLFNGVYKQLCAVTNCDITISFFYRSIGQTLHNLYGAPHMLYKEKQDEILFLRDIEDDRAI